MRFTYTMISAAWQSMTKYSKIIIKYGGLFVIAILTAAISFHIIAGNLVDYYTAMDISDQLFKCLNPSVGVIGLGVILFECASHAYGTADE